MRGPPGPVGAPRGGFESAYRRLLRIPPREAAG
jgi:hypothetical protein